MPATAADLKFFAAKTMLDTADGGGPRSATLVQDGVSNVVFPDVSASDRSAGRVHIRKVYPSVTNNDLGALLGTSVVQNAVPSDPAVSVVLFKYGVPTTTREEALNAFRDGATGLINPSTDPTTIATSGTATSGSATLTSVVFGAGFTAGDVVTGGYVLVSTSGTARYGAGTGSRNAVRRLIASAAGAITLDRAVNFSGSVGVYHSALPNATTASVKAYGSVATTAVVSSGTDALVFASRLSQVAGVADGGLFPGSTNGFGDLTVTVDDSLGYYKMGYRRAAGNACVLDDGDIVTLWDEQTTAAASQASGSTVNVGRTNLDQIAVVSAAGVELARFMLNGATPSAAGVSANLTTGVVTFSAGWTTQTVTVRHRIAHRSAISAVGIAGATLAVPVTRDFPSGSIISSHVPLGDLQARAYNMLAQQAWTRVWSDAVVGSAVGMMYSGTPTVTNKGAETDRWAIVFKTGNTFDCYSEILGLVASGDSATAFSPINPVTGAPFFTLASASWAATILVGSVLRFNTESAAPPIWALRSVVPSTATGTQTMALRMHGSVDA